MNETTLPHRTPIRIPRADHERLLALVERSLGGRDAALAEQLETEIDRADVVEERPVGVVTMEDRVTYEDESSGARREVSLAWPGAADPSTGRISVLTPIGVARSPFTDRQSAPRQPEIDLNSTSPSGPRSSTCHAAVSACPSVWLVVLHSESQ